MPATRIRPLLFAALPLAAQAPLLQDAAEGLRQSEIAWARPGSTRSDEAARRPWGQAGAITLEGLDRMWMPLVEGQGLGTALKGRGLALQGGGTAGAFEAAFQVLALRGEDGQNRIRVHTGFLAFRSEGGWRVAFEQMPMKWGFGPLGGHLLGTSARPFPALRVTTRWFNPTIGNRGLGSWQVDAFTGRLEGDRRIPVWQASHDTLLHKVEVRGGDISAPFQSGWRLLGRLGDLAEVQAGVTSMWGGRTPDGRSLMAGQPWYKYLLAATGAQNAVALEASGNPTQFDPNPGWLDMSNGIAALGFRMRLSALARWVGADGAYGYYERSGENVNWQWKDFARNPLKAAGKDLERLLTSSPRFSWKYDTWQAAPSFSAPTHALGLQLAYRHLDVGLEYRDNASDDPDPETYHAYNSGTFLAGHSRSGDSLGIATGGSVVSRTLRLDWNPTRTLHAGFLATYGMRCFREHVGAWQAAHPGAGVPLRNTFLHLELALRQQVTPDWRWGFTLGHHDERNLDHVQHHPRGMRLLLTVVRCFHIR